MHRFVPSNHSFSSKVDFLGAVRPEPAAASRHLVPPKLLIMIQEVVDASENGSRLSACLFTRSIHRSANSDFQVGSFSISVSRHCKKARRVSALD